MKTFTAEQLKGILKKHIDWFFDLPGGERATLRYADLCGANLRGVPLRDADLREANLCDADLRDADLRGADMRGAYMRGADMRDATLRGAILCDADMRDTDLCGANLRGANLCGTDMRGAFYPLRCPETGAFIGYKAASGYIVKLEICEDALRSSATSGKCRCSKAKVLSIEDLFGERSAQTSVQSNYDPEFIYEVGKIVEVPDFDADRWNECAPGIHFFITREEVVKWL